MSKDFNDFRKTLTEDRLSEIAETAARFSEEQPPVVFSQQESNLGNTVGSLSLLLSIDLLEAYHEWLQEDSD